MIDLFISKPFMWVPQFAKKVWLRLSTQRNKRQRQPAYAAVVASLVIMMVSSLIAVGLLLVSNENLAMSRFNWERYQATALAHSCAEIALNKLKLNLAYGGNETITINGYTCQINAISGSGSNTSRTIQTLSTVDSVTRKMLVQVAQLNPTTTITSWQEVADF